MSWNHTVLIPRVVSIPLKLRFTGNKDYHIVLDMALKKQIIQLIILL